MSRVSSLIVIAALLPLLSGCSSRTPDVTHDGYRTRQFDSVDQFFACREVRQVHGTTRAIVDYVATRNHRGGNVVFSDLLHHTEEFSFDVPAGDYDVYCLRGAGHAIDDPHEVYNVLFCLRGAGVARWQEVPDMLGTDGYNLAITGPADAKRLLDWMHGPDDYYNTVIGWIETGTSSRALPDPRFAINDRHDSDAILIHCGKCLVFFAGYDAQDRLVAILVNVF
jgi:hypothetical protein